MTGSSPSTTRVVARFATSSRVTGWGYGTIEKVLKERGVLRTQGGRYEADQRPRQSARRTEPPVTPYDQVRAALVQARKQKRRSQKEVADAIGDIAQTTVSHWETGAARPPAIRLWKWGDVLDVKIPVALGAR